MENANPQQKTLYRSRTNRLLFGVCGGLGEYFEIDPLIFRVLFIALCFGGGSGVLVYLVLAFLIPKNPFPTPIHNRSEHIDVKQKAHELASELKEATGPKMKKGARMARLFIGFVFVCIGLGLLVQNLNLVPAFHMNFWPLFNVWPLVIILVGLLILSKN